MIDVFIDAFWTVGTALVPLAVPVVALLAVFRLVKDLMR